MLTDFNDIWHIASWKNLTLADCKFVSLSWENVTQYLSKNKVRHKFENTLFSSKKVGGSEKAGCVVWQIKWKQCYRECSKWPNCAWTHAPSRFRHWSMASSTTLCCSPAHVSTSRCWKMTFLTIPRYSSYSMWVRWANLQPSNVQFLRDSVCQKLLKSVHFLRSYSKIKIWAFFETQCISNELTIKYNVAVHQYWIKT